MCNSIFNQCPNDVLVNVLKFLDAKSLGKVALVCRVFKTTSERNDLWQYLYVQDLPRAPLHEDEGAQNWKKNYSTEYEREKTHLKHMGETVFSRIQGLNLNPKNPPIVQKLTDRV